MQNAEAKGARINTCQNTKRSLPLNCFPGNMSFYTSPVPTVRLATLAPDALDPGMEALVAQAPALGYREP